MYTNKSSRLDILRLFPMRKENINMLQWKHLDNDCRLIVFLEFG